MMGRIGRIGIVLRKSMKQVCKLQFDTRFFQQETPGIQRPSTPNPYQHLLHSSVDCYGMTVAVVVVLDLRSIVTRSRNCNCTRWCRSWISSKTLERRELQCVGTDQSQHLLTIPK